MQGNGFTMIPLLLRVQNFLSYGSTPQTIDFRPYKLICLSGKNGHGKSALLDAITWALWGSARKTNGTSKADQGVLKLGQTEMMVGLDFISNGQTYRIRRVFSTKYGKPSAHVDFGTYNIETDTFIPLTEKTIRRTQEVIDQVLGVDYDAFINSSFIRQGQSNEFSKKSPKDRKDVLAAILGLNRYEKARKLAIDESKRLMIESEYAKKFAAHINEACLILDSEQEKLVTLDARLKELALQHTSYERSVKVIAQEKEKITVQQQKIALIDSDYKRTLHETTAMKERFYHLVAEWKKNHRQLLHLPDKKILEERKQAINTELQLQAALAEKNLSLRSLQVTYKQQEQELVTTLQKNYQEELHTKKIILERIKHEVLMQEELSKGITKEINQILTEQSALDTAIATIKHETPAQFLISDTHDLQKLFERYKTFYQKWIDAGNIINNEMKHLHDKKKLIDDTNNPSCPLCEQNVSQARKRFLMGKLSAQDQFLIHRFAKLKRLIGWIKEVITNQHKALEASKKIDIHLQDHAQKSVTIEAKQKDLDRIRTIIQEKTAVLAAEQTLIEKMNHDIVATITANTRYQEIMALQQSTQQELLATASNPTAQEALRKELQTIEEQEQQWFMVAQQAGLQTERRKMVHELCITIKKKQQELTQYQTILKEQEKLHHEQLALQQQEAQCMQEMAQLEQTKTELLQQKGALEHSLKKLHAQKKEQATYEQQAANFLAQAHEYTEVAAAYGKDGLQALLIEDALPEIEQEANDLLSKLTDNQTHIFIESLRDLKKGGTKETLDINISDSNGIRPYEMFSGGEAFRIDFALRIAISKLLARRAGTSLQTLIIDEGFGSQDEEGLSRIMDVIYKIQDDFEKVIIVSHLTTMKDQFPVHFIIEKENQGSLVTIRELA
jgi:exonuclease SbcC